MCVFERERGSRWVQGQAVVGNMRRETRDCGGNVDSVKVNLQQNVAIACPNGLTSP